MRAAALRRIMSGGVRSHAGSRPWWLANSRTLVGARRCQIAFRKSSALSFLPSCYGGSLCGWAAPRGDLRAVPLEGLEEHALCGRAAPRGDLRAVPLEGLEEHCWCGRAAPRGVPCAVPLKGLGERSLRGRAAPRGDLCAVSLKGPAELHAHSCRVRDVCGLRIGTGGRAPRIPRAAIHHRGARSLHRQGPAGGDGLRASAARPLRPSWRCAADDFDACLGTFW